MKWFANLSTRNKLLAGFGLMFVLLVAVIFTAYHGLVTFRDSHNKLYGTEIPISKSILKFRSQLNREWFVMDMLIKATDPVIKESWIRTIRQESEDGDNVLDDILTLSKNNPEYTEMVEKLIAEREVFNSLREKEIIPVILQGNMERARVLLESQNSLYSRLRDMAIEMTNFSEMNDQKAWLYTSRVFKDAVQTFVILGVLALVFVIGIAVFLTQIIAGPLTELAQTAEKVSYGDLTVTVPGGSRTDEVGKLMLTFGMMISGLKMMTVELGNAIEVLDSASGRLLEDVEKTKFGDDPIITKVQETARSMKDFVANLKKLVEQYKV